MNAPLLVACALLSLGAPTPAPADAPPSATTPTEPQPPDALAASSEEDALAGLHLGEPTPLAAREATLKQWTLEVDGKGGLVGTSPARFAVDVRFGLLPWLELRTGLAPYPDGLMARARLGSVHDPLGAFLIDAGAAHVDLGIRLAGDPEEGGPFGLRAHVETGLAWERAIDNVRVSLLGRYRHRFSTLSDDEQQLVFGLAAITMSLTPSLAVTGGASFSTALFDTSVKEASVVTVEWDRPFFTTLLARDEGSDTSLALPLAFTLSRTESFDMDVFGAVRVYPEPGFLVGAGLRLRFGPT